MRASMLNEVNIEGSKFHLTLMDGSKWFVNPGNLPTIATWIPTANIEVRDLEDGSSFHFQLINVGINVSIRAMEVP
jgi:hypothetical protein